MTGYPLTQFILDCLVCLYSRSPGAGNLIRTVTVISGVDLGVNLVNETT